MVVVMMRPAVNGRVEHRVHRRAQRAADVHLLRKDVPTAGAVDQFGLNPGARPDARLLRTAGTARPRLAWWTRRNFPAAVEMSGYFHPPTDPSTRGIFADQDLRNDNDLGWRLQNLPLPQHVRCC